MLTDPSFPERLKSGAPLLTAWCGLPDPATSRAPGPRGLRCGGAGHAAWLHRLRRRAPGHSADRGGGKARPGPHPGRGFRLRLALPRCRRLRRDRPDDQHRRGCPATSPASRNSRPWASAAGAPMGRSPSPGSQPGEYFEQGQRPLRLLRHGGDPRGARHRRRHPGRARDRRDLHRPLRPVHRALAAARTSIPTSAEVEKALDHALSRAKAAGKLAAIYAVSGARAAELARKGFHMVSIGSDISMLRAGAQAP